MLKAPEVGRMLGISARAVYQLAASGKLRHFRFGVGGGALRFEASDVQAYKSATPPPERPLPCARELRVYERLRLRAEQVGGAMPRLSPYQQAIADLRVRNLRRAPWADPAAIDAIYAEARRMTAITGIPHHVDHEIPLLGRHVSGLHVENNLRVIPAHENISKGNKVSL